MQNASCRCSANGSNPNVNDAHVSHGSTHSEIILPDNVIAKIDRITRIDKQLFLVALRQFFVEIKWLEASLGRRVLCDSTLTQLREKLLYYAGVFVAISQHRIAIKLLHTKYYYYSNDIQVCHLGRAKFNMRACFWRCHHDQRRARRCPPPAKQNKKTKKRKKE